jgi:DNA-binding beta-propeller fold protein YncE
MSKTKLVLSLGLIAGCGVTGGDMSGDGGGSDDPGGDRPAITDKGVSTLCGWTKQGFMDGNRQVNLFNNPVNVAVGPDGNVYIADFDNSKLRSCDPKGNSTTIIAKTGFARPFGLAFAGDTLYVSTDRDCNGQADADGSTLRAKGAIWKVDVGAKTATCLMDNLGRPRGLAALKDGRLAVADYAHHTITIFDPSSRTVTPLAGTRDAAGSADGVGAAATFNVPYALAQRADGKLIVTDWANNRIRLVGMDGTVTTVGGSSAGFADGGMSGAQFNHPQGLSMASNGDVFITDQDNYRVRKISADGSNITTIAGSGTGGFKDSEDPSGAQFYGLEGLSVTPDGKTVYVADGNRGEPMPYNSVRVIKL